MLSTPLQIYVMSKDVHPQRLHNICTKDLATDAIQEAPLHAKSPGRKHVTEFVKERLLNKDDKVAVSFKTVPKRNKPQTLESLYDIPKDKTQNDRKVVWKADRDVIQQLITSYEGGRKVTIQNVMRHELIPVPISMAETDGSLRTGTTSTLATLLTNPFVCPRLLIDGMALVSRIGKLPKAQTFGDFADVFAAVVFQTGKPYGRIVVMFDRYRETSIKSAERQRRCESKKAIRRSVEGRNVPFPPPPLLV